MQKIDFDKSSDDNKSMKTTQHGKLAYQFSIFEMLAVLSCFVFSRVALKEAMMEQGWCELIPTLLDSPDHDSREKILNAMKTLSDVCSSKFRSLEPKLTKLRQEYIVLAKEEAVEDIDDKYFTVILETVNSMISLIGAKDEL